jgi:hypothetical protein
MSDTSTPIESGTTDAQPDYETLEDVVNAVEDFIETAEDRVGDYERFEVIEQLKEDIEDLVDDAQDHEDPARLEAAEEQASELREEVDNLQDEVGFDDADVAEALDDLQDEVYTLEEHLEDISASWSPFVVISKPFSVSSRYITPQEILEEVPGHTPNEEVLYWKHDDDSPGSDEFIPADKELDLLLDGNVFTAYNHENPYGCSHDLEAAE